MAVREQTQLNENPMRAGATELSGPVTALITAWLEVRVLPGPTTHSRSNGDFPEPGD